MISAFSLSEAELHCEDVRLCSVENGGQGGYRETSPRRVPLSKVIHLHWSDPVIPSNNRFTALIKERWLTSLCYKISDRPLHNVICDQFKHTNLHHINCNTIYSLFKNKLLVFHFQTCTRKKKHSRTIVNLQLKFTIFFENKLHFPALSTALAGRPAKFHLV